MTNRFCVLKCDNDCNRCGYGKILDGAYWQGRADAESKWIDLPKEYAYRLDGQSYQRGRRDYEKEIVANFDEMDKTAYRIGRADGIAQGRWDAIDEFAENLIGEIEAYASAGHNLDVVRFVRDYKEQMNGEADERS